MPVDMKESIAEETLKLLFVKRVKKLTVKDIVEACGITRQAFYYHFADIPDLLQWILQRRRDELVNDFLGTGDLEERIHHFLLYAIHVRPIIKRGLESNFSEELEALLWENMYEVFQRSMEQEGLLRDYSHFEQDLIIRYHYQAIKGLLQKWSDEDTKNIDRISRTIFKIISKQLS